MTIPQPKPTRKILKLPRVSEKTGLSRSMIYVGMDRGTFPKPVKLSSRLNGWPEDEIDQWIESRIAERDQGAPA